MISVISIKCLDHFITIFNDNIYIVLLYIYY